MSLAKFALQDVAGRRVRLNPGGSIVLAASAGFGANDAPSGVGIQRGFYKTVKNALPQPSIVGDLLFMGDAYSDYLFFVNWLYAAEELCFIYAPYGSTEYFRRVELKYLEKTVREASGVLRVPVAFSCLTPWYLPSALRLSMAARSDASMRYEYRYTNNLMYAPSSADGYTAEVEAAGHVPAAIKLEYAGAIINPIITLVGESSGKTIGQCKITTTLESNEKLLYSTAYLDSYVRKVSGGTVTDLINNTDLSLDPFPRVPVTEPCKLQLTAADTPSGTAEAQIFYYYRSV